jgi:hypothetical protein
MAIMSDSSIEAGDRRAVEAHPIVQRALHLVLADGEALELSEDVREPQTDELDVLLLDAREDLVRGRLRFTLRLVDDCHPLFVLSLVVCKCSGARRAQAFF